MRRAGARDRSAVEADHHVRGFDDGVALLADLQPSSSTASLVQSPCASASTSRVGPAVAEAHEVLDFGESFIALEELLAYALDSCSHVCPIAVFAGPCDEALVVQTVVDRSIGHPAAHIRRQKMDDVVLAYGEVHVEIVPMCPADIRVKDELTADHETDRGWSGRRFRRPDQTPQTPGQNLDAPGLVDEVNGPPLEGEVFLGFESIAGEKHDRQFHANLAQFDEQFDARYLWKVPVDTENSIRGGMRDKIR